VTQDEQKTVIVTGGNTGLGYQCARALAASSSEWHVIIASRNPDRAATAVKDLIAQTRNEHIDAMIVDLASLASVRRFAQDYAQRDLPPLRAVICNAGIQIVSGTTYTEDGFETTFAVNHLGHFLLVNLLLRHLVAPARVVFVSSGTHDPAQRTAMPAPHYRDTKSLAYPDTKADDAGTAGRRAYTTSKLCNLLCAYELARRLQAEGRSTEQHPITANVFDPGLMPGSGLARDYGIMQRFAWRFILPLLRLFVPDVNSPATSGSTLARLVLDPRFERVTGKYFVGLKEMSSSQESYDQAKAAELWKTSAELVQLQPHETILRLRSQNAV
jgi:NAD(P)-dependent dehydrogenase (short-subunit alcohol dehydrogenase family)